MSEFRRRLMGRKLGPIEPASDGKIWAYYDVNTTESATTLIGSTNGIGGTMNVDGVNVSRATSYTFSTTGTHLVKFTPTTVYVGRQTFKGVPRLTELYLPTSIVRTDAANENTRSIGNCNLLTKISIGASSFTAYATDFSELPVLTEVVNMDRITAIRSYAFRNTPDLNIELNIPNLTVLGDRPFINSGITKIVSLGSTITSLSGGTNSTNAPFLGCAQLTEATLPPSLTTITAFSFYNCPKLKTLTMLATTPPSLGSSAFNGTTSLNVIYVPADSVASYQSSWSGFSSIIQAIPTT